MTVKKNEGRSNLKSEIIHGPGQRREPHPRHQPNLTPAPSQGDIVIEEKHARAFAIMIMV